MIIGYINKQSEIQYNFQIAYCDVKPISLFYLDLNKLTLYFRFLICVFI